MIKDFDGWNEKKKEVNFTETTRYFYEREIWWCTIGVNVGFEQDGKSKQFTRPILVFKKFSKNVFIGLPLSTTTKEGKYYYQFQFLNGTSNVLLSQIRLLDSKRLGDKIGRLDSKTFAEIRRRVKNIL